MERGRLSICAGEGGTLGRVITIVHSTGLDMTKAGLACSLLVSLSAFAQSKGADYTIDVHVLESRIGQGE
jgi:hypothetical protein